MKNYLLAVLLGTVEGLTEFLPISSTGHLLVVEQLLGMDLAHDPFWKLFTVVIQLGAILAVVAYFARRLLSLVVDFISPRAVQDSSPVPRWRHPVVLVLAAVIPAGVLGVLAKGQIDDLMEHTLPIGISLIVGGLLIEFVERLRAGHDRVHDAELTPVWAALVIGCAQAVAIIPGVSRSASTILGGRLCGLSTRAAADFSFLLSIPTMLAAASYSLYKHRAPLTGEQWMLLGIGFGVSFVVALAVIIWFLKYVRNHGLRLFVVYRLLVGAGIVILWALGGLK